MVFHGEELREIIGRTQNKIELHNVYGRCYKTVLAVDALKMNLQEVVGIGNRRRIRFLRSRTQNFPLNAGSHTTSRVKGEAEVNIAHPLVRQHRPAWSK